MYRQLVIKFVEIYDYNEGTFNVSLLDLSVADTIGYPDRIYTYINDDNVARLALHYKRGNDLELLGLPKHIENSEIDFTLVNRVLNKNSIKLSSDLWDGGERGSDQYIVTFDATLLVETRKAIQKETQEKINSL